MQVEQKNGIPDLWFDTVEELLTTRRIVEAIYGSCYVYNRLNDLTTRSMENDWQVKPHNFERNEARLIWDALQNRARQTDLPPNSVEDRDSAHAQVMIEPHLGVMASILGLEPAA